MYYLCAPVIIFPLIVLAYKKLRPRFSIKVNCWFCGENTVVPYGNKNCWDCPHCDQYNGFNEDGDYNKEIPAQSCETLNFPILGVDGRAEKYSFQSLDILCPDCNFKQQVKVKLLAEFVPFSESNFDEEVGLYKQHLEKTYALCWGCSLRLQKYLLEQDTNLHSAISAEFFAKNQEISSSFIKSGHLSFLNIVIHGMSVITIASIIFLFLKSSTELQESMNLNVIPSIQGLEHLPHPIAILGMLSEIVAVLCAGRYRLHAINAVSGLLLTTLQSLYSPLVISWISSSHLLIWRPTLALVTFLASFTSVLIRCHRLKQVMSPSNNWRKPCHTKSLSYVKNLANHHYNILSSPESSMPFVGSGSESMATKRYDPLSASLKDIYITTPGKHKSPYRVSLASAYDGLGQSEQSGKPKSVVHPARLNVKSVTQASWVAGGYWSNPRAKGITRSGILSGDEIWPCWGGMLTPPPSLNGSQESQNVSPTASMCGDDMRSVFSEPVIRRRSAVASVRSWPPSLSHTNRPWVLEHDSICQCCRCHSPTNSSGSSRSSPVTQRSWQPPISPPSESCVGLASVCHTYRWQQVIGWIVITLSGLMNLVLLAYFVLLMSQH